MAADLLWQVNARSDIERLGKYLWTKLRRLSCAWTLVIVTHEQGGSNGQRAWDKVFLATQSRAPVSTHF